ERDEITRRHGRVPPHDDDAPEELLDGRGGIRIDRSLAADDTAEKPARAVDANESSKAHATGLARRRDLRMELRPERPLGLIDLTALATDLLRDLLANL